MIRQSKNASPLKTILNNHQPTLIKTLESLQQNLSQTVTRTNTQQSIKQLQTIFEAINALPKDRFQCLKQIGRFGHED